MSFSFKKIPLVAAIAMVTAAPVTQAQMLEEVIVTAQKRTESLQDVPISVTAIQGDKLEEAGIANMSALADYVPNLTISDAAVNTNIYMRGMGSGNNQAFEQSVGMYIDGIYMGRGRQYRSPFLDIQRVEVLRGPQGTLFGKNTVAGAINVTTASPDMGEELNGSIAASVEDNDGFITEGYVSGSVTDTLAMRLAFKYNENAGTFDNDFLGDDEINIEDTSYRLTAVWQPTDNLDVNVKYSNSNYERTGAPSTTRQYLDADGRAELFPNKSAFATIAYLVTDVHFPDFGTIAGKEGVTFKDNGLGQDGKTVGIGYAEDGTENDTENFVAKLDYSMGDFLLTSITGYSGYESVDAVDVDWLPLQFISRDDDQEFSQFSQEFRITSPGGEFFDYVAGAYYEKSDLEFDRRVTIDTNMDGLVPATIGAPNLMFALTGGAYSADQIARNHAYQLDSESYAFFGQGTFNISDSFRVTLGLRYTKEDKDVDTNQCLSDSTNDPDRLTSLAICSNNPFMVAIQAGSFNTYQYDYQEDRSTDAWLPAANFQWDVFDDTMLYLSLSKGFKSGGFTSADDGEPAGFLVGQVPVDPSTVFTDPNDDFEFDDEEVDALEIGGKHTLLDGGMTLNWAYFYTEYTDLQTSVFKGVGFGVTNAGSSIVQGIELDVAWQATDSLRLGANGSWLDASYDEFQDAPCTAIQLDVDPRCGTAGGTTNNDLSDEETTYAPEFSAAFFVDYSLMMGNGMEFFAGGEVNYKDEMSPAGDNDPIDRLESFVKTNARLGLRGDAWEVMAYGRNIFDEEVFSQSADTPVLAGSHFNYMDEGAVFGLRGKYSF
ncbi:MAG: iron complex outermembrane receptor protein [Halioglobus sp.]|jgi:iron complex outermembrane receptor protein